MIALLLLLGVARGASHPSNALPDSLRRILKSADSVVLYSLEPISTQTGPVERLDGFQVLGRAALDTGDTKRAVASFDKAIADWDGLKADCFDPRHALRVMDHGHTYDFLLCYACHQLVVYRDGQEVADIGASGLPGTMNDLLRKYHLPISHSGGR